MKKSLQRIQNKEFFEELANRRMEEIQDLSKQIDFNNLRVRVTLQQKFCRFLRSIRFL